jgi:hypothetical protein
MSTKPINCIMQAKVAWAEAQSRSNDAGRYSAAQWRSLGAWWKAEVRQMCYVGIQHQCVAPCRPRSIQHASRQHCAGCCNACAAPALHSNQHVGHDAGMCAWLPQEIDLLRDPWTSGRKIVDGSWKQTKAGAREFWAIFGPGGRLHPAALFESQVHALTPPSITAHPPQHTNVCPLHLQTRGIR